MKLPFASFSALTVFLGTVGIGQASPLYFTFDGDVISIYDPQGTNVAASAGLSVGSPITYTFLVDFDADGYYSRFSTTYSVVDYFYSSTSSSGVYLSYSRDYFYVDYIDGDALTEAAYYQHDEYNYGYNYEYRYQSGSYSSSADYGYLYGESWLDIRDYYQTVADWSVGDSFFSHDRWSEPQYGYVAGRVTLSSISATNPYAVPEPATLLLVVPGVMGLVGLRQRRRK